MEFKSLRNIESSFRQIRLFGIVFLSLCAVVTVWSVWNSYRFAEKQREKIYVLDNGKSLMLALSQDLSQNRPAEAREHVRRFHEMFFTLSPEKSAIEHNVKRQAEAIARTLALSSRLTVPVVSVVTGEGGSGGALALGVGNRVLMLENAVYSVLSPEGFAAILWKDASRSDEACGVMKLTAADLLELEVADRIIPEPEGGAHTNPAALFRTLDTALVKELNALGKLSGPALAAGRYKKFRAMGAKALRKERT